MKQGVSLSAARAAKRRVGEIVTGLVGEEVSVGIARLDEDRFCVTVNLTHEPDDAAALPSEVEGVPVQVKVVGKIRKR